MDLRERALSFPRVTQDGDEEGMLITGRLPTAEGPRRSAAISGSYKEREYDDETLARLREKGRQWGDERRKNSPSREEPYLALRRASKRFLKPHRGRDVSEREAELLSDGKRASDGDGGIEADNSPS